MEYLWLRVCLNRVFLRCVIMCSYACLCSVCVQVACELRFFRARPPKASGLWSNYTCSVIFTPDSIIDWYRGNHHVIAQTALLRVSEVFPVQVMYMNVPIYKWDFSVLPRKMPSTKNNIASWADAAAVATFAVNHSSINHYKVHYHTGIPFP